MNFETIKRNYERGLWSRAQVKVAVRPSPLLSPSFLTAAASIFPSVRMYANAEARAVMDPATV